MERNRLLKKAIISFEEYERLVKDGVKKDILEQRIDKAIEYIETLQINVYDSQGYWIRHNDNEDLSIENTKKELLEILKGD